MGSFSFSFSALVLAWVCGVGAGCRPDFGAPLSLVTSTRLLAVRAEPAEAAPGDEVAFTALVASPGGTVTAPSLDWSFCAAPTPFSAPGPVADDCLAAVTPLARAAPSLTAALPSMGCALFGPELPPRIAGAPEPRPHPPDASGGYYQPLRVDLAGATSVALPRIRCNLAGASLDVATEFRARYHPNANPTLGPLTASAGGAPLGLDAIAAGAVVTLTAAWPADAVETYPIFDVVSQTLVDHSEAMRVSWFASAGAFADERTGVASGDPARSTSNTWRAPSGPTVVHLWIVLRDDRGGVATAGYDLGIR